MFPISMPEHYPRPAVRFKRMTDVLRADLSMEKPVDAQRYGLFHVQFPDEQEMQQPG